MKGPTTVFGQSQNRNTDESVSVCAAKQLLFRIIPSIEFNLYYHHKTSIVQTCHNSTKRFHFQATQHVQTILANPCRATPVLPAVSLELQDSISWIANWLNASSRHAWRFSLPVFDVENAAKGRTKLWFFRVRHILLYHQLPLPCISFRIVVRRVWFGWL